MKNYVRRLFLTTFFMVGCLLLHAQSFTVDDIKYEVVSATDKQVEVRGYVSGKGDLTLSGSVEYEGEGYDVVSILLTICNLDTKL